MNYEVYHDESQEAGYWHGALFVPERSRSSILDLLRNIRQKNNYDDNQVLNFKGLKGMGSKTRAIWMSMRLFVLLMRRRMLGDNSLPYPQKMNAMGTEFKDFLSIDELHHLKFVLLRVREGTHREMFEGMNYHDKVCATMSFALKGGGVHFFDMKNQASITNVYLDGHDHYGQGVDQGRLIKNLREDPIDYCTISERYSVDDRHIGERRGHDSLIMMNFVDNIVGALRCAFTDVRNEGQAYVLQPLSPILKRWRSSKILKNPNSRWRKCFYFSECYLEDGEWEFRPLGQEQSNPQQALL